MFQVARRRRAVAAADGAPPADGDAAAGRAAGPTPGTTPTARIAAAIAAGSTIAAARIAGTALVDGRTLRNLRSGTRPLSITAGAPTQRQGVTDRLETRARHRPGAGDRRRGYSGTHERPACL